MTKKRGLGRNLDALLSRKPVSQSVPTPAPAAPVPAATATANVATVAQEGELRHLPIELLDRGRYQPRKDFSQEALQELADSIGVQGILQPIVVRSIDKNRYEIIAGERRWRAAQLAGLTEIPALIKNMSDEDALAVGLIENIQRQNLSPLEEAVALQRLIDEFSMTHQQVAEAVGKSRTAVTNILRLLTLQPDVKILLEQGKLEMGHARALLALTGIQQAQAARIVAEKGMSVRETEDLVRQWQQTGTTAKPVIKKLDPDIQRLQQTLSDKLGAPITFKHNAKGKGQLIIHYNNLDQLDGILEKIS